MHSLKWTLLKTRERFHNSVGVECSTLLNDTNSLTQLIPFVINRFGLTVYITLLVDAEKTTLKMLLCWGPWLQKDSGPLLQQKNWYQPGSPCLYGLKQSQTTTYSWVTTYRLMTKLVSLLCPVVHFADIIWVH